MLIILLFLVILCGITHKLTENLPQFQERELSASICRSSFYDFVVEFWDTVVQEKPVWNWHIKYVCDQLQAMAERVFKGLPKEHDLILNIAPGSTKSLLISVMFPAWCWTRMPTARFICGSHTQDLVLDLSRKCRDVCKSDKYNEYFPYIIAREDQDNKAYWMNTRGGSRFGCTVGGKSPMGLHAHFILVDDPLDPRKAVSTLELKTANNWMWDTMSSRKVDKRITPTILVMQRLHQDDPTGHWLERAKKQKVLDKIFHICLPAEIYSSPTTKLDVQPSYLADRYVNGLMDPIRLPKSVLEAERLLGQYRYAGQFLQNPIPLGGGMFKAKKIKKSPPAPKPLKFKRLIRYWDKAATFGGGAFSVGLLMGETVDGAFWILDIQRGQWDTNEREVYIKRCAWADGRHVRIGLEQEPGSGGKESVEATQKSLPGWKFYVNKPTGGDGSKAMRADPFSTQVNAGNVYMVEEDWNESFLDEMEHFPLSKYKDQIDAASGAFSYLSKVKLIAGAL